MASYVDMNQGVFVWIGKGSDLPKNLLDVKRKGGGRAEKGAPG